MIDNEHPKFDDTADQDSQHLLLATIAALVFASGSVLIWRTKTRAPGDTVPASNPDPHAKPTSLLRTALATLRLAEFDAPQGSDLLRTNLAVDEIGHGGGDGGESKSARSKERRRRGKDPLKELVKGGKRSKSLLKQLKQVGDLETGTSSARTSRTVPGPVPRIVEPQRASRSASRVASSRSSSASASISRSSHDHESVTASASSGPTDEPPGHVDALGASSVAGHGKISPSLMQTSPPNSSTEQKHDSRGVLPTPVPPPQTEATNEKRTRSPSRGASTSDEVESSGSGSLLTRTASTSPPPSSKSSGKPLESLESVPSSTSMKPSHSMPFYASPPVSLNDSNNTASAPGDWNHQHLTVNPPAAGTSTSSGNDTTYRKPPRFRSKSRSPMAASMSFTNPISPPVSDGISTPYGAAASSSAAVNSDTAVSFTYPTLNSPPAPSISPLPVPSSLSTAQPRRTPTPRRAPTPSHTPPPSGGLASGSVSTQTQIASMRGALEAARMREEKSRLEAEKWAKECEMVRWRWGEDVGVWRRKEAEYQAHIHYLMHHMQILAMAPSQPPSASSLSPVQSTSQPQTSSRSTSSQSHPPSPMPSSRSSGPTPSPNIFPPQSQFHLHMSPPVHSPVLPPFGPSSSTGYAASPSLQQQSMFSLFFPSAPSPAPNPFSSVPSSVSGTPSTGSRSPAADFISPYNRGRRPTRDGMEDAGWVTGREAGDPNGHRASDADGAQASETDDNEQFNDVLADAILKRPGSIRVRSERSSASASAVQSPTTADEKEKRLPPFTFPSLSNAGYVEKEFAGEDEGEGDDLASNALPESSVGVDSDTSPYIEGARPAG